VPELELTRTREDRRLYALDGVGTVRLRGWTSRDATIAVAGAEWAVERRGIFAATTTAYDAAGAEVGIFRARSIRRGGDLEWAGRPLTLRPASAWRERYALADGERELAVFDGKGWGKRPVKVTIADLAAVAPALLLFTAVVVRGLSEDSASAAGGATAAVVVASG
jgi:hypothetical protein